MEIYGRTKRELFANAAEALFDVLIQHKDTGHGKSRRGRGRAEVRTVEGTDPEDLLINFLRELLYLFNGLGLVVKHATVVNCSNKKVTAQLTVEPYHPKKHRVRTEIKAVTYHGLSVQKTKSGWKARVIFDV